MNVELFSYLKKEDENKTNQIILLYFISVGKISVLQLRCSKANWF